MRPPEALLQSVNDVRKRQRLSNKKERNKPSVSLKLSAYTFKLSVRVEAHIKLGPTLNIGNQKQKIRCCRETLKHYSRAYRALTEQSWSGTTICRRRFPRVPRYAVQTMIMAWASRTSAQKHITSMATRLTACHAWSADPCTSSGHALINPREGYCHSWCKCLSLHSLLSSTKIFTEMAVPRGGSSTCRDHPRLERAFGKTPR